MAKPFKNKEYIDWITEGNLLTDTVEEGTDRVTLPEKMQIRDMSLTIYGIFNGATLTVEYSPDFPETPVDELVPANMRWFSQPAGQFTAADLTVQTLLENIDIGEGWLRMRVSDVVAETDLAVKTRPRVEQVISN